MDVDEKVGYPKAYAKLYRDCGAVGLYTRGPPFTLTSFAMQQHEVSK